MNLFNYCFSRLGSTLGIPAATHNHTNHHKHTLITRIAHTRNHLLYRGVTQRRKTAKGAWNAGNAGILLNSHAAKLWIAIVRRIGGERRRDVKEERQRRRGVKEEQQHFSPRSLRNRGNQDARSTPRPVLRNKEGG